MRGLTLATRRVYSGRVLAVDVDEVQEPGGISAVREVVRHPGSVAALPVHDDGRVVLVRQYRYAVDSEVWEIPAGRLEAGEAPLEGARRELEEEAGLRAAHLEPLAEFFTTPGFCDEAMHVFRATCLEWVPPRPEPDERFVVREFTMEEAREMIEGGERLDSKTLVALLLEAERRRADER